MSIDSPSAQMQVNQHATDDFNYIDTYVEFIVEVVLKYTNAIPESQDRQQRELQQHKQFEVMFHKLQPFIFPYPEQKSKQQYFSSTDNYAYQFVKEINPPPPKA